MAPADIVSSARVSGAALVIQRVQATGHAAESLRPNGYRASSSARAGERGRSAARWSTPLQESGSRRRRARAERADAREIRGTGERLGCRTGASRHWLLRRSPLADFTARPPWRSLRSWKRTRAETRHVHPALDSSMRWPRSRSQATPRRGVSCAFLSRRGLSRLPLSAPELDTELLGAQQSRRFVPKIGASTIRFRSRTTWAQPRFSQLSA